MRLIVALVVVSLSCAAALPIYMKEARFASVAAINPYKAPGPGDERGPCPFINTLANHGYLNHNGKGITQTDLSTAFINVLGTSSFFGKLFAKIAYNKFVKAPKTSLNLNMLSLPLVDGGIEHKASLTRLDTPHPLPAGFITGPPDVKRLEGELAVINAAADDKKVISIKDLSKIRVSLEKSGATPTPAPDKIIALAEACLFHGIASGKSKGPTVAWFRSFLEKETFPVDWVKPDYFLGFGLTNLVACMAEMGVDKIFNNGIPYLDGVISVSDEKESFSSQSRSLSTNSKGKK